MSRLFGLLLLLALAGVALAVYNTFVYEVVQPFPLSWNHDEDELRLIDLERERRQLWGRLGAGQRVMSLAGAPQVGAPDEAEKATLARLDEEIAALRARIASRPR